MGLSPAYVQLINHILDRPVHFATETKSAALGAPIKAATALNGVSVSEIRQRWAPALAVGADLVCDELQNRCWKLINKEVTFASSKAK